MGKRFLVSLIMVLLVMVLAFAAATLVFSVQYDVLQSEMTVTEEMHNELPSALPETAPAAQAE